ncbi:pentatricopeptide repeat-containing protein, putative [Ricinus communis]|uniref:Pentatricopeptide repeat-containing protein, putative n=1 Tax=Ricinus communis TaxID=3988 RepID=B9RDE2_RICCO|nr:pentatricopeptide repeat-containing protein, putative [Ricinus communis]
MAICARNIAPLSLCPPYRETTKPNYVPVMSSLLSTKAVIFGICKSQIQLPVLATANVDESGTVEVKQDKPRFKWAEIGPNITKSQQQAISELPPKMTNRCKTLVTQIICSSYLLQNASLSDLLSSWVRIMKPRRTDWLSVLKQLKNMEHPLYLEVAKHALVEESFEANVRDYTKVIYCYGKQTQLQDAETTLLDMKKRGFVVDQVTLTTMIDMYSKAGNLNQAEETFEELKLLAHPWIKEHMVQ